MNTGLTTAGLHHITAIAADAQKNIDFYEGFLGQRFVKRTVNFDDPSAYHLYYGDYIGSPGTAMTFFSWQGMSSGVGGVGETNAIAYRIPKGSHEFWSTRAQEFSILCKKIMYMGETSLQIIDPDGHQLFLVESAREEAPKLVDWKESPIPSEYQLMGFYSVRLVVASLTEIESTLIVLGYMRENEVDGRVRFKTEGTLANYIDVVALPDMPRARQGVGSIHHIAFRAKNDDEREQFRQKLVEIGLAPTGLVDRTFFHSTYVWTPAGILVEIATDEPGFTVNETAEMLGEALVLPEQYEHLRAHIEAHLPPIILPRHNS